MKTMKHDAFRLLKLVLKAALQSNSFISMSFSSDISRTTISR